jgi:nicotinamidase-related amidase
MGRVAVLVIDMVRDFTDMERGKTPNEPASKMVPLVHDFVEQARSLGALVIWVIDAHRPNKPDFELENVRRHCEAGTLGVELAPPLQPREEDYILNKRRYSAFVGTDLDLILRDNHVDTIFLTGTKTNVCIRATAQDGFSNNYRVVVPRECVATDKPHLHEANLEDIDKYMGKVVSAQQALDMIAAQTGIPLNRTGV